MDFLLDTNILIAYSRDNDLSKRIESDLELFSPQNRLMISVVSLGELESIILKSRLGQRRSEVISRLLRGIAILDVNVESIIHMYGKIDAFSQGRLAENPVAFSARNMGKNDLWIAATAATFELTLVTMDKDFDHLAETFLNLKYVSLLHYK